MRAVGAASAAGRTGAARGGSTSSRPAAACWAKEEMLCAIAGAATAQSMVQIPAAMPARNHALLRAARRSG
ncbi:hypothetical protein XFLAVUS301_01020 [Xanthobacter flavus]|uniref:Uncharacterized protein n=1 Tax=Xanthobacter flavus TaxID=281 RepID=A0A9W6CDV0_XANFL|nr:hypothetical protein XFLAVUS301_01020 [Xanthobacter flavus]